MKNWFKKFGGALDWPSNISGRGAISDPFGDWDKDGVPNMNDCEPKNPRKQDALKIQLTPPAASQYFNVQQNPLTKYMSGGPAASSSMQSRSQQSSVQVLPTTPQSVKITPTQPMIGTAISQFTKTPSSSPTAQMYSAPDKYGNKMYTAQDYKTLTTTQTPADKSPQKGGGMSYGGSSYSMTDRMLIARTPNQTYVVPRPVGWTATEGPALNPGYKANNSLFTIPAASLRDQNTKAYVTPSTVINPYYVQAKGRADYNLESVPRPYGWGTGQTPPALNPGYKIEPTKPFIPAAAIRDENSKTYVDANRTMILNPYYQNKQ